MINIVKTKVYIIALMFQYGGKIFNSKALRQVAQGKEVELALQKFTRGKNGSQHFAPKLLSRFIVQGEQHGFFWLRTNNV